MNCSNGCGCGNDYNNNSRDGHYVEESICLTPEVIKEWYEYNPNTNVLTDKEKNYVELAAKGGVTPVAVDSYTKAEVTALLVSKVDTTTGMGLSSNDYTTVEKAKLASLVVGSGGTTTATVQTDLEIKTAYENNIDTNVYTDAEKSKLAIAITSLPAVVDISGKVDIVAGKQLSTEDYTTAEKAKLAGLSGSHFKGTHTDEAALVLAHPTAEPGSYAYVMDTHNHEQMYVWDDTSNLWENLGHTSAVHMTDAQIKTQYENNPDTNALTDGDLTKIGTALQTHQNISGIATNASAIIKIGDDIYDGTMTGFTQLSNNNSRALATTAFVTTAVGTIPSMPTGDGEYVLTVVGGVSTWGLNSGGAPVYDAYMLGSSLGGNITLSPFHKFDGLAEETRTSGINFADGNTHEIYPMYQAGMTDGNYLDSSPMFLANDFSNSAPMALKMGGTGGTAGNPFNGADMKAAVAGNKTLEVVYDNALTILYVVVV